MPRDVSGVFNEKNHIAVKISGGRLAEVDRLHLDLEAFQFIAVDIADCE